MEADARAQLVTREASRWVAKGYKEVSRTRYTAVLEKRPFQIPVGAHIFLSVIFLGFWLPVWAILATLNREPMRVRVFVDSNGDIRVEESAWNRTVERKPS